MNLLLFKYKTKWFLQDCCIVLVITFHILTLGWFAKRYSKEEIEEMYKKIEEYNKKYNTKL